MSTTAGESAVQIIEPRQPGGRSRMRELWAYRHLLRFFAGRAVDKIASRTVLGKAWLVIRPLADTLTRALVFGGVLKAPSGGVPYLLFFIIGMWAWRLFDRSLFWATRAIEINRRIVRKMYFPHLLLPLASTAPGLIEFGVFSFMTAAALALYGITDGHSYLVLGPNLLLVPLGLLMSFLMAVSLGLITSVFGAFGRDTRYSLVYVLEFWMFVTPVIYPLSAIGSGFRPLAELNPMTPVIEMVRFGLVGSGEILPVPLVVTAVFITATSVLGLRFFSRFEAAAIDSV